MASLTRVLGPGRLDLVEDVVQEALLRATRLWPFEGVPDNPAAWLTRVARNLALDAIRHRKVADEVMRDLQAWAEPGELATAPEPDELGDDRLRMIFTCCHPALSMESRIALTLKSLGGFGVSEIANALLSKDATVAQRLSRAKDTLRKQDVAFEVPAAGEVRERVDTVLEVLYLMFNEGYRVHRGEQLVRVDLVHEALRLAGLLLERPETASPKVHALLALMLFLGARLPARVDAAGEPLTLALQDRSAWDREWIQLGFHHFQRSAQGDALTPFHVEAAIASVHAMADSYQTTDWSRILRRYDELLQLRDTAVVRLNRAVALAKVRGPDEALRELDTIDGDPSLREYPLLPTTRGHLLWGCGEHRAAAAALRQALDMRLSEPERAFLRRRLAACERGEDAPRY